MSRKPHMIFDAIHHVMEIEAVKENDVKILRDLIDCPHFQRLKGIKQLGLADMVFPTATHTRFSHSTGAAFLASKILKQLRSKHPDETHSVPSLEIILAALLHDIGHGPFSHAFEDFFKEYLGYELKHERWTAAFIHYLNREGILPEKSCEIIKEILFPQGQRTFNHDIISSQLDCDRLDYLLRDSHFCGVSYGTFDLDWLLHTMTLVKVSGTHRLGITQKGVGAVENYLICRRLMYLNICHNKNILGFTDHLVCFLIASAHWISTLSEEKKNKKRSIIGPFLFDFLHQMNCCKEQKLNVSQIIELSFERYKFLTDYDVWFAIRNLYFGTRSNMLTAPQDLIEITTSFMERKSPKVREIDPQQEDRVKKYIVEQGWGEQKHRINIIKPHFETYDGKGSVYVQGDDTFWKIQEKSKLIDKLIDSQETRLFLKYHPQLDAQIKKDFEAENIFI